MTTRTILLAICVAIAAASPARAAEMAHGGSMPSMLETATFSHLGLERLEGRFGGGGQDLNWQGQAWLGSDDDKIWFKSEGAVRRSGRVDDGGMSFCTTELCSPSSTFRPAFAPISTPNPPGIGLLWARKVSCRFLSSMRPRFT